MKGIALNALRHMASIHYPLDRLFRHFPTHRVKEEDVSSAKGSERPFK